MNALASLPDDARLWLFVTDHVLDQNGRADVLSRARAFTASWRSHGRPVAAEAAWVAEGVLAVGGRISPEELNAGVSGCGIDAMTRAMEAAADAHGFTWLDGLTVVFRSSDGLRSAARSDFRRLAREGAVTPGTEVFDGTAATVGELRANGAMRPAADAWHGRTFWRTPATEGSAAG